MLIYNTCEWCLLGNVLSGWSNDINIYNVWNPYLLSVHIQYLWSDVYWGTFCLGTVWLLLMFIEKSFLTCTLSTPTDPAHPWSSSCSHKQYFYFYKELSNRKNYSTSLFNATYGARSSCDLNFSSGYFHLAFSTWTRMMAWTRKILPSSTAL